MNIRALVQTQPLTTRSSVAAESPVRQHEQRRERARDQRPAEQQEQKQQPQRPQAWSERPSAPPLPPQRPSGVTSWLNGASPQVRSRMAIGSVCNAQLLNSPH